uniref:RUN domain-containing protein n=1 Tax=Steinernema glaseri TaxID=37863 RepID=A0A1I8ABY5_9BILA
MRDWSVVVTLLQSESLLNLVYSRYDWQALANIVRRLKMKYKKDCDAFQNKNTFVVPNSLSRCAQLNISSLVDIIYSTDEILSGVRLRVGLRRLDNASSVHCLSLLQEVSTSLVSSQLNSTQLNSTQLNSTDSH